MKIKQMVMSLTFLAVLNVMAFPILEYSGIRCLEGSVYIDREGTTLFESAFPQGMGNWDDPIVNYNDNLTIGCSVYEGKTVFYAVLNKDKCDTAWEISSKAFPVTGDTDYAFTIRAKSSLNFLYPRGHAGSYNTMLQWLDAKGEPLEEVKRFGFATSANTWNETIIEGRTPKGAAKAKIFLGGDSPNFAPNDFLAIEKCHFILKQDTSNCYKEATFISSPFQVTDNMSLAWDAECPNGTAVQLQVAFAEDVNGKPGTWSAFMGPGNNPKDFYTNPNVQTIAPFPGKWLRYRATLKSNKQQTPLLKSVTIAGVKDSPYQLGDNDIPVLTMLSASPTEDTLAPIQFRVDDNSPIVKNNFRFYLDGNNMTARLTSKDGVFTYTPEKALQPPGFSHNPYSWNHTNYNGAITFTNAPGDPDAFRITREKPEVDTSFSITSWPVPVQPNQNYLLKYTIRHDIPNMQNQERLNTITWRDKDKNIIGKPSPFLLEQVCPEWKTFQVPVTSPANAATATVTFGLDRPNIFDGHYLDIKSVDFQGPQGIDNQEGRLNLHTIRIYAEDMAGNVLDEERTILYDKPATSNIVTMRDDGFVLIDGKPFFPIGLYAVWKKDFNNNSFDKAFVDLKNAGFNFAHTYNSTRNAEFTEFLNAADRHGIKLWITKSGIEDFLSEKKRPSILAWYLGDDTSAHIPPEVVRRNHLLCHALDNAHLTTQADVVGGQHGASNYTRYVHSTDSFLPEIYPMHEAKPLAREVPQAIMDMKTIKGDIKMAGNPVKSIWAIIQHFEGWGWKRFPTYEEQRAMTYLSIIHGAHGVTWYTYGGKGNNHGVTHTPEHWKLICSISGELSKLQDVLSSRNAKTQPVPVILDGPKHDALKFPSISCLLKDNTGKKILLTANSATEQVKASIQIPGLKKVNVLFENRSLDAKDTITDSFAPFAVHIYELEF